MEESTGLGSLRAKYIRTSVIETITIGLVGMEDCACTKRRQEVWS